MTLHVPSDFYASNDGDLFKLTSPKSPLSPSPFAPSDEEEVADDVGTIQPVELEFSGDYLGPSRDSVEEEEEEMVPEKVVPLDEALTPDVAGIRVPTPRPARSSWAEYSAPEGRKSEQVQDVVPADLSPILSNRVKESESDEQGNVKERALQIAEDLPASDDNGAVEPGKVQEEALAISEGVLKESHDASGLGKIGGSTVRLVYQSEDDDLEVREFLKKYDLEEFLEDNVEDDYDEEMIQQVLEKYGQENCGSEDDDSSTNMF
jgi:hypothetical protein